jgi:hypothetical protein
MRDGRDVYAGKVGILEKAKSLTAHGIPGILWSGSCRVRTYDPLLVRQVL